MIKRGKWEERLEGALFFFRFKRGNIYTCPVHCDLHPAPPIVSQRVIAYVSNKIMDNSSVQPAPSSPAPQPWRFGFPGSSSPLEGVLPGFTAEWSSWQYMVTFLLGLVVYDQGNEQSAGRTSHPEDADNSSLHYSQVS